eukprot:755020-Hanusia_phi.AAC.6
MMDYSKELSSSKSPGNDEWLKTYSEYAKYARRLKGWYSRWIRFLIKRRRTYPKCTDKNKKCGTYETISKEIKLYREQNSNFQKLLIERNQEWLKKMDKSSKAFKRISADLERIQRLEKARERYVRYRRNVAKSREYRRGSAKYKKAIERVKARFEQLIKTYEGGSERWTKYTDGQKECTSKYYRGFRYIRLYRKRLFRMYRAYISWLGRLRRSMSRHTNEYKGISQELRETKKKSSDAYKALSLRYKKIWKCYKKGSHGYAYWYRRYRHASRWYRRMLAARRTRDKRRTSRNKRRVWKYKVTSDKYKEYVKRIDTRWKKINAIYQKWESYWKEQLQKRELGSSRWLHAYYRWRRYVWRGYRWYWWYIRFMKRRRRYLKRYPDMYKAVTKDIETYEKERRDWIQSYYKSVKEYNEKLKSKKDSKAARRIAASRERRKETKTWRSNYHKWMEWERKFWSTKAGSKDSREVLYKMRKWRTPVLKFFKDQVDSYDKKLKTLKKGTHRYEHYWKYQMWWRYYVLWVYRRMVWFDYKREARLRRGSALRAKVTRLKYQHVKTMVEYLKDMKTDLKKHLQVCRRGGRTYRYWWRWYRWTTTWYSRYRSVWRSLLKGKSKRYRRRVWQMKAGSRRYRIYVKRISKRWQRVWQYYVRKMVWWRARLYKYRPGSHRWRRAFYYYRLYWVRLINWGKWWIRFTQHRQRYYKSETVGYKKLEIQIQRWQNWRKNLRHSYLKRLEYWSEKLKKYDPKGKAYQSLKSRTEAYNSRKDFRSLWREYYHAMYYTVRSKPDSERWKKYEPTVEGLRDKVYDWYKKKWEFYESKLTNLPKRSRQYTRYFRFYASYKWRGMRVHMWDIWYKNWLVRRLRGSERTEARKKLSKARIVLRDDYKDIAQFTKTRMSQVRKRSREWNWCYAWYRWTNKRIGRARGRARYRSRRRTYYWFHRFYNLKVGSERSNKAREHIEKYYNRVLNFYKGRMEYWKGKLEKYRPGYHHWRHAMYHYRSYNRRLLHWYAWWINFHKKWSNMYSTSSSEYKNIRSEMAQVQDTKKKAAEEFMNTVKTWVGKLPNNSAAYNYWNRYYTRYSQRSTTYRQPLREMYQLERSWWAVRKKGYKDEEFLNAWKAMRRSQENVMEILEKRENEYSKKLLAERKHKRSRQYRYYFRRMLWYSYYRWNVLRRRSYWSRWMMKYGSVDKSAYFYKKLWRDYKKTRYQMYAIYNTMITKLHQRLHELNKGSRWWRYWYRWYRWARYKKKAFLRWRSSYSKRKSARTRTMLWSHKYRSQEYMRVYARIWKYWLRMWQFYTKRMVRWRNAVAHTRPAGSKRWRRDYYRMMRYQGRMLYWMGWWIRFTRKRQRVFTKHGTSEYNALERSIAAWTNWRSRWREAFTRRINYWRGKMKSGTVGHRLVERYWKLYGGRETYRDILRTLRQEEHKCDGDKMKDYRSKLVKVYDEYAKKWEDRLSKYKKASRRYIWSFRHMFWYKYYGMREFRRGLRIAIKNKNQDRIDFNKKNGHERLEWLINRLEADKKGLTSRAWWYRVMRGTEIWLKVHYKLFL